MKRILGLGVIACALLLAGCGSSSTNDEVSTSVVVATTTMIEDATPSPAADSFSLIGGGSIDLTRGPTAMPIALWFWAPG